ncbi:hypothetical protein, partial [Escherichia coli]|uniref:hypothetical protein n=1 Tax=Escherichia coli TaxID=562 RepID=UPI001BC89E58
LRFSGPKTSIICSPMTSLKTSIKTITYLSDIGCLEIQGASLMGKVKYHFLTIKRVLFLVYQTISIHSKPLEIIKTQVFHWLIYSHMK